MKQPVNIKELRLSLKVAKAEAQSYANRLTAAQEQLDSLREHNANLRQHLTHEQERLNAMDKACAILFLALEKAQQK